MAQMPDGASKLLKVARDVGGAEGRSLARAVDAAVSGTPDLSMRTRLATAQTQRVVAALGGYHGTGAVPLKIKKRMRRDAQIRFALAAAKAPILSAPMYFHTRSAAARAFATQTFLDSGFIKDLLDSSMNAIEFGFQNHEALWRRVEDHKTEWDVPKQDGGVKVESETRGVAYLPSNFKDLDPEMVHILWDEKGTLFGSIFGANVSAGTAEEVKQALKDKRVNFLPPDKMFLFTPIFEWQNYYGEGRLDWAYDHWYWSNLLYLTAMRWYERKSDPPLLVRAPASAEVVPDPEDIDLDGDKTGLTDADARQDGLGAAVRAAGRLRSHGIGGIPSEPYMDENGKPSNVRAYDIEELAIRDMHPAFLDMLDHLDKKKTRAIFVPDTVISRDRQVGTLGSTEAITDVAVEIQNQILNRWLRAFNDQVLAPWLAYNGIKDPVTLVSPGVFRDNRALLKDMILKAFEADMLAEQKLGRVDPNSLTVTFDRTTAARAVGLPIIDPDPNAPPRLIPLPDAGGEGGGEPKRGTGVGSSPQTSQKGDAAPGKRKAAVEPDQGKALALARAELEADAVRRARQVEDGLVRRAANSPARETLSTTEKAIAALLLWTVLRADKEDASGNPVKGIKTLDGLVWQGRTLRPARELAASFTTLDAAAAELESRGLRLARGQTPIRAQAQRGVNTLLAGLRNDINTPELQAQVALAVDMGRADVEQALSLFDPDRPFAGLDPEEVASLTEANTQGILLNVDNIARRNGTLLVEKLLMGFASGRSLGMIEEVAGFRFNRLHNDLTLEAHLRAAYRGAVVAASEAAGVRSFIQTPSEDRDLADGHDLDFWVGTSEYWQAEGERRGVSNPHSTFGWHHGSTTYWYPVPATQRIRTPFTE